MQSADMLDCWELCDTTSVTESHGVFNYNLDICCTDLYLFTIL